MRLRRFLAFSLLASTALGSTALAAPPDDAELESADDLAGELARAESVAQAYAQVTAQPVQQERLVRQTGVYVGVPFFLTDRDVLRPGVGFHIRGGWELGYIVPEVALGWQLNLLDVPGNTNLQSIWLSAGLRVQFLNYSNVVPFVSAAFRPTWFSTYDPDSGAASDYTFEPAVTATLGAMIELTANFGLEAGLQATAIFSINGVFEDGSGDGVNELFLYPYFGATYYY